MSLRLKLLFPPLLLLLLIVVVVEGYWLPSYRNQTSQVIVNEQQHILKTLTPAVLPSLLTSDLAELYALLEAQSNLHTEWQELKLYDAAGQILYPLERSATANPDGLILQQAVENKGRDVGMLELRIDADAIAAEKTKTISVFTDVLLGLVLLVSIIVALWQEYLVRRPLSLLSLAANNLANGDFSTVLPAIGKDEIGQLAGAFAGMRTTVEHAQQELQGDVQREASRAQAIMDHVFDAIITINSLGIISSFNPAAERIFGYQADEIIGQNVSQLMPEPDRSSHDGYLQRHIDTGVGSIIGKGRELLGQRKDGTLFSMELAVNEVVIGDEKLLTGIVRDISQRKQIEDELRASQNRLSLATRAAGVGVWDFDVCSGELVWDDSMFELYAVRREDFSGAYDAWSRCVHKDDLQRAGAELQAAIDEKKMFDTEFRIVHPNGDIHHIRALADVHCDAHGDVQRVVGTNWDTTNKKQAEAELASQRRQIEIINSIQSSFIDGGDSGGFFEGFMPDILELTESEFGFIGEIMSDPDGKPYIKTYDLTNIAWDEPTRELYEMHATEGLEFHNLDSLLGKVVRSGEQVISNDPANDPDSGGLPEGHPALNAFLGVPVYQGGEMLGMIGLANRPGGFDESVVEKLLPILSTCAQIFTAITKERQQQAIALEFKRSNSFMSGLVENLQAGLLVEDEAGRVYALNQTYCDMFDKDEMPLMIEGEDCTIEFEKNQTLFSQPEALLKLRQECLVSESVIVGRELLLEDGRVFEQDYVPIFFEDEQGQTHRSNLWSYRDISEHKQIQKTLEQAKETAEAAATVKSQFLATMSHELRTPMNGVLGMLHLLGKTELDEKQQRFADTATHSGEMLLTVINDILDFSKLEADKQELESIPFDLEGLLEQSVALLANAAQEKGVELICSVDFDLPRTLKGDPTRLRQVLISLINNAIKFTEQGDIVVYATRLENGLIRLGVRDSGIGMTAEQQTHLFKAFSQVDSSHTRKYGGTGLGLAISQKLVMAMGGKIRVASSPALGSDFSFDLELEIIADSKPDQYISKVLSQRRILVVDDNENLLASMRRTLKQWQASLTEFAVNGSEALAELRRAALAGEPYDIAILDWKMPGMDGLEVARSIRADASLHDMKVVMFSAFEQKAPAPEVDVWVSKPFQQSKFFNTLVQLLGEHKTVEPVAEAHSSSDNKSFSGRKLLLVEDNFINQEVAREILSEAGFDIDIRENGVEALQAVQANDYDVVLMDIQMPVMDGLAATESIRALGGRYTTLPIIAMTAHALGGDAERSLAAGMDGHLSKPFDPAALFTELAKWFEPGQALFTEKATVTPILTEDLPVVPGIDLEDGLQRLNGNWVAYKRILLSFRNKQAEAVTQLKQLIQQGQWDEAARLAHSLKGSGGNLGAKQLYETAAVMEQVCREGDADAAEAGLESLRASLAEVIDGLAVLETKDQVVPTPESLTEIDSDSVHVLLDELLQLLDNDLGAAQSHLASLQQHTVCSDYAAPMKNLESALNSFDIESAKAIVQSMQVA